MHAVLPEVVEPGGTRTIFTLVPGTRRSPCVPGVSLFGYIVAPKPDDNIVSIMTNAFVGDNVGRPKDRDL